MAHHPRPPTADALPLSDLDERMLREGGHVTTRTDLYLSKGRRPGAPRWQQGIPRKPKTVEHYPGEFRTEPDPNVSNAATTGRLVRRMLLKRWNRQQILDALSDSANVGGQWLRWVQDSEDLLDRFIEGARLPRDFDPLTGNPPIGEISSRRNPPISAAENPPIPDQGEGGREREEFKFIPAIEERFLVYAEQAPRSRTDMVERGPLRHKGAATAYVDHLTAQGLFRWVQGPRTKPRGPVPLVAEVVRPVEDFAALVASWLTPTPDPPTRG